MEKLASLDHTLIEMLSENSRTSTSELARSLGVSRATVKDHIEKLVNDGIIKGFTIQFNDSYESNQIESHVMIKADSKKSAAIFRNIKKINAVRSLQAVNGIYDFIAIIKTESTQVLDDTLDTIGEIDGIESTLSSIVLSTKFKR
jgi:DNA-binding Lrp family transcriptional regulator